VSRERKPSPTVAKNTPIDISPLGPEHSQCFSEVFKLKNKLQDFSYISVLFGNRDKRNL
jgi:hypothetical protein